MSARLAIWGYIFNLFYCLIIPQPMDDFTNFRNITLWPITFPNHALSTIYISFYLEIQIVKSGQYCFCAKQILFQYLIYSLKCVFFNFIDLICSKALINAKTDNSYVFHLISQLILCHDSSESSYSQQFSHIL